VTDAQLTLAPTIPGDVESWRRKNPESWRAVVRWAHEDREAGLKPSTRLYLCLLRRPKWARALGLAPMCGDKFIANDHLSSGLARALNAEYPDLKCPVRDSCYERGGKPKERAS